MVLTNCLKSVNIVIMPNIHKVTALGIVFVLSVCLTEQKGTFSEGATLTDYYAEPYRPQFHFSPSESWMNDPNGMVYYEGEYHLFYQYYPDSTVWGPMHWGHAISTDLVHWEHQPIALYPDSLGWIFSGSAVVDWENTSGLGTKNNPPLVAIYTYHSMEVEKTGRDDFQTQGIAYSLDKGRSWTKYAGNPVLRNPGMRDFRDPKVMWYEREQKWIMTLAVKDHISFYSSPDLIHWGFESDFGDGLGAHGGVWECPDLFPLEEGSSGEQKWVLLVSINSGGPNGGSGTQYFIGDFDGKAFHLSEKFAFAGPGEVVWLDYGTDNYAGVTWSDIPSDDNRRIFIGWMSNWQYAQVVPTHPWRSAMTLPRELRLVQRHGVFELQSLPVEEVNQLYGKTASLSAIPVGDSIVFTDSLGFKATQVMLDLDLDLKGAGSFEIHFFNSMGERVSLNYSEQDRLYYFDREDSGITDFKDGFGKVHQAPYMLENEKVNIKIWKDISAMEVFVDGGRLVLTEVFFPQIPFDQVSITAPGKVMIDRLDVSEVKSIWRKNE